MEKFVSGGSQTPGEDGVGAPLFLDQFRGPYGSTTEIIRVDQKAGANPHLAIRSRSVTARVERTAPSDSTQPNRAHD